MKIQRNKKWLYNHKSKKGVKITVHTVIELAYKFSITHKVSNVLVERFSQDPLETDFWKQRSSGAWRDNLPFYDFDYANTFRSSKVSGSLQIPSYQTNPTSKLNEYINKYINKLTLRKFNSFYRLHSFITSAFVFLLWKSSPADR